MRMYARFRPSVESMERKDCPSGFGPAFGEATSFLAQNIDLVKPVLPFLPPTGYETFGGLISATARTHAGGPDT
jgi:hypothetical protein